MIFGPTRTEMTEQIFDIRYRSEKYLSEVDRTCVFCLMLVILAFY